MNKKKRELTELIEKLEKKLVIIELMKKIIKTSYMVFSVSALTTMIIGVVFRVSNVHALAFWLLFTVFILFFVEKSMNNVQPTLTDNVKY